MSETSENLRTYQPQYTVEDFQLNEFSRNPKYAIFRLSNESNSLPLLKSTDVTVSSVLNNPYTVVIHFNNKKEEQCVERIDDFVVSLIEKHSEALLGEQFTKKELFDEHVFIPSIHQNQLKSFSLNRETNNLSNAPSFHVYEPSKCTISAERIIPDVICRCAFNPWYIQVFTKTRRLRVLWFIQQCMIMEEPLNTNYILDADDEEENDSQS